MQAAALCFPKSHRVATEKDQSSHCGNNGISAADSVPADLIPVLTSIPLQQLPWIIKGQETRQVQQSISSVVFFLENFIPHPDRIKDECSVKCGTSPSTAYDVLQDMRVVGPKAE